MTSTPTDDVRHIIFDTDTGIDDAMALIYLAGSENVEISAITSVYGNTHVESALTNIARVLELLGLEDTLVAKGAAKPMVGEPHIAHYVHGRDGLGDVWSAPAAPKNLSALSSAELIVEMARSRPGYYDLLPVGPMTNIGLALELEPDLLTMFRSTVIMGGSGPYPPLGVVQTVDANIHNDPDAAALMFSAPRTSLVMVGVNVTGTTILDEAMIQQLRDAGTAVADFSVSILDSYMNFYQHAWGRRVCPTHDGLAAALLIHPEWITASESGPVNVTTDGYGARARLTRTADGTPMSVPAHDAPDTLVVLDVDRKTFLADFVRILAGTAGN